MNKVTLLLLTVLFFASCSGVPKGTIIAWHSNENVPTGWAICNGANGTPDLTNRFLMGTANSSEIGQIGGQPEIAEIRLTNKQDKANITKLNSALHDQGIAVAHETHTHVIDKVTNLPPYYKVVYIIKK